MNMETAEETTRRPADLLDLNTSTNKVQPKSDLNLTKKPGLSHSIKTRGFIELNLENKSRSSETIDGQSGKTPLDIIRRSKKTENTNVMGVEMRHMNIKTHVNGFCDSSINKSKLNVGAIQILPHLYLGSQKDVMDKAMMDKYGITYVLNVSTNCTQPPFIDSEHFHRISVKDNCQEKMMPHMKEAITFIEKVRKLNKRVLVHCLAGVSRSATVAIAYVIYHSKTNFEESYRFVKDKRQSISPNFNFLGQLMEFEKTLKSEGHMTTCAGEIVSDDCKCASKLPDQNTTAHNDRISQENNRTLNFYDSETALPQFILPVTCSVAPISLSALTKPKTATTFRHAIPHTPTSSFCKRRRGPALSKIVFTPNPECPRQLMTPALQSTNPVEQSTVNRLRIDVHVTGPSHLSDHSARLGSDGTEMDDQPAPCITVDEPNLMAAPSTTIVEKRNQTALTLKAPPSVTRHRRSASSGVADIKLSSGLDLKRRLWDSTCKSTSCLSPAIKPEQEECRTKRSVSLNETTNNYFNLSTISPRSPRKFLSCNSRSPKVMRKSFNLNLRPTYSYNKQINEAMTFDCSHSLKTPTDKPLKFTMDGNAESEALTLNSISPLTISSPTNDKEAESLFPISPATCPVTGSEPFLRTCITPSTQIDSTHKTTSRVSFKTSLSFNAHGEKNNKAFTLSPGCDLKLKWRNRNKRRVSCDSGYASSQTSSSFTSPTTHIAFSPCETTIDDTIDEPQEETVNPKESNQSENECVMAVDENRKFVSEPSSPLPVVGCRKAVEIMSCS